MTRRAILVRHAKSSWKNAGQDDHDRPLNARGRRQAEATGRWIGDRLRPDAALISAATRTRETWERMASSLGGVRTQFDETLYLASSERIIGMLKGREEGTVLVLAHNPGIAEAAHVLAQDPPDHDRFFDYPTCATTILRFDIGDWGELAPGTGSVVDFTVPEDLE